MTGRRSRGWVAGLAAAALLVCGGGAAQADPLVIATPNWYSGQASANILKVVIERELGLQAETVEMGTMTAFVGLDGGSVDIHPEVWRPNLDSLVEKYVEGAGSVALSPAKVEAWQGICASRDAAEAGITDIADLSDPEKTGLLDTDGDGRGEMWIGAPSWSSTAIERIRASSYGYAETMSLIEIQEDVGMAGVDAAVATSRPIVFACYAPHAVFRLHDVVRLSEPEHDPAQWQIVLPSEDPLWAQKSSAPVAWDKASYQIAYASRLRESNPRLVELLERVNFTPEEATEMSYALQVERQDPYAFAKEWVARNEARVKAWAQP